MTHSSSDNWRKVCLERDYLQSTGAEEGEGQCNNPGRSSKGPGPCPGGKGAVSRTGQFLREASLRRVETLV